MSAARASRQAAGSAPAAGPITEAWRPDNGTCALCTQDPAVKDLAARACLRPMAAYYRPDGKGVMRPAAWQFAGDKDRVMRVLAEAKKLERAKRRGGVV